MRERVAELGGRLTVDSRPGAGTTVVARLPLGGSASPAAPRPRTALLAGAGWLRGLLDAFR